MSDRNDMCFECAICGEEFKKEIRGIPDNGLICCFCDEIVSDNMILEYVRDLGKELNYFIRKIREIPSDQVGKRYYRLALARSFSKQIHNFRTYFQI